jgi:ATP-binding cassette subfamily C (CFTR/MRP) protein 10
MSSPEFVGLTISYSLSITSLLAGFLNAVAETEQEFVAVERVDQYCDLEKEINANGSADPPFGWPYQGEIEFENVHLRYRDHLPYALNGITNKIEPCEKVGIVGRTGAGKSSLVSSILRTVPITKGKITIDHVNIATLSLDVLRTRVAVVPQEPFLFNGTVRENLDPRGIYLENELWDAITSCLVSPLVQSLGGLSAKIESCGSNLSAGQKQLLCLTRAMLKRSKIVLVDEGTANLDYESETAIQIVLKNQFKARTVLMIAHRLSGLNHADRIICMKNGEILEEGTPYNLSNNPETYFYSMLQEQQNLGPHDKSDF